MFSAATKTDNVSSAANYIEEVFSTWLYTGTGAAQSISNGIGLGNSAANNSSISLNASTPSYLTFSSQVNLSGNFCIQAWVYPTSLTGTRLLFSSTSDNNVQMPRIQENGGIYCYVNGTEITSGSTASALQANVWTHLAMTRSGSTFRIFVNGTLYATATYSGTFNIGVLGVFFFSGSLFGTPYAFGGNISNAQIVSGSAIYTTDFTPPQNTLIGGSVLLGAGATPLADTSGTGKTVTQFGSPAASSSGPWAVGGNYGGLVWCKSRTQATSHGLFDTARGVNQRLSSNGTGASANDTSSLTAFNSNGFSLGSDPAGTCNTNTDNYASWTFRKQAKFFDVVTYTGNGSNRTIAHNLGSVPGCIIVKAYSGGSASGCDWAVYHRSTGNTGALWLNQTNAFPVASGSTYWNNTTPTSTDFTVSTNVRVNESGTLYVAYLFAHDAGGFGAAGTDNVISCGSFTTNGSGVATVDLGYEPQFILFKRTGSADNWEIADTMRGFSVNSNGTSSSVKRLNPNTSDAETTSSNFEMYLTSTGFKTNQYFYNATYIYIAIRRGPMKTPTSATNIYQPIYDVSSLANKINGTVGPIDLTIQGQPTGALPSYWMTTFDRLRGSNYLVTAGTAAETAGSVTFDTNVGVRNGAWFSTGGIAYNFRRAPGFFDVVCYTGTGSATTFNHNLTVVPELMIVKSRNNATNWAVYCAYLGGANPANRYVLLNSSQSVGGTAVYWNDTAPTSTVFTVGTTAATNTSSYTYVNYLFATVAGVSKVGSYTGTGALQTINCGFASGARFVLIKRTDSTGDWYVYDSARGITSGNDPYLFLNSAAAEVTGTNYVDTASTGFQVTAAAPAGLNANGGTYIFLAIA